MATILIVDDSETQRGEIRVAIEESQLFDTILEATDGYQGLKMLLADPIDLVLCDLELPGLDGEKLLRVAQQNPAGNDIPFLFLTGTSDLDRKARLIDSGACDAIAKPFHPADLIARLKLHLKVQRLQEELRIKNEELELQSSVDGLTQLRTRRYVFDRLAVEFLRARRFGSPLSVLMADLDHFKLVNDEYGHPGGDAVLRSVSDQLNEAVRANDVAGRYGGEELFVVMQADLDGAVMMGERWRQVIESTSYEVPGGRRAGVTVSIGVAQYDRSIESSDALIAVADQKLYLAKENGRNRVES
jgi:two-component system cell cycle response regulator